MNSQQSLKNIAAALRSFDNSLREKSKCKRCGLPTDGLVLPGETKKTAGLCCCAPEISLDDVSKLAEGIYEE